jgi:hypothetical protein
LAIVPAGRALADIPRPAGWEERCTIENAQDTGDECISFRRDGPGNIICEEFLATFGFCARCAGGGTSHGHEIMCRRPGGQPLPPDWETACIEETKRDRRAVRAFVKGWFADHCSEARGVGGWQCELGPFGAEDGEPFQDGKQLWCDEACPNDSWFDENAPALPGPPPLPRAPVPLCQTPETHWDASSMYLRWGIVGGGIVAAASALVFWSRRRRAVTRRADPPVGRNAPE